MSVKKMSGRERRRLLMLREAARIRQNNLCFYCNGPMTDGGDQQIQSTCTAEHLVPRSSGGGTTRENIVAACAKCNSIRSGKCAASKSFNEMQSRGLANVQAPRNMVIAHKLLACFGEPRMREILRQASEERRRAGQEAASA